MVKKSDKVSFRTGGSNLFLSILVFAIALYVVLGIFIFGEVLHSSIRLHNIFSNLFAVSFSLIVFITSIIIYFRVPPRFFRERKAKFFLSISLFLFFMGDLIWLIDELFLGHPVPIGSVPDFIWITAYVFLIVSLIYFISVGFRPSSKNFYLAFILGIILGSFILYLDVAEDLEEGSFTFAHAVQDSYILFDMVALLMILYLVWPLFSAGKMFYLNPLMLGFGIATRVVFDQFFAEMSQKGTYYTGHPIDLVYVLLYIFIIASFYFKSKLLAVQND